MGAVALLAVAWLTMLLGGAVALVLPAHLGSCPPTRRSGGAQGALVAGVLGLLVTTVLAGVRRARRARAWPAGAAAVGVVLLALLVAAVAYLEAASGLV